MMTDSLKILFESIAPISDDEFEEALPFFKVEILQKNEYFSKAGRIADRIGFVNSGLLRSFYTIKGKETTTFFQRPGMLATALASFLQMKPALENIQALETSELIIIDRKDLLTLYEENWKWQQIGRSITEQYYIIMEKRLIALQSQSALERYENFLLEYPELLNSVPLYYIASFLGISPETLSRIRREYLIN
jgi:CRP-like cAMP-binding protein